MGKPNLSAEVTLPWGDGQYTFALKGKQIEHLEKACDTAIAEVAHRVMSLRPYYGDLYQIILLGLEGGGMPPTQAKAMMDRYFDGRPLADPRDEASPLATAAKVMQAAWFGMEDLEPGEAEAGENPAKKSTSQPSGRPSSKTE